MTTDVSELAARVDRAIDALADVDVESLSPEDAAVLVVETHRLRARMEAATTGAVQAFERRGDPESAVSTSAWVFHKTRIHKGQAKREVSNARGLRTLPKVAAAFAAGEITESHVSLLVKAQRFAPEAYEKAEDELLDSARLCRFDRFRRHVLYFQQYAEPDRAEEEAQDVTARRCCHLSRTFEDTWQLDALLDPVSGAIVNGELARLEKQLFEEDWAEAKERLGDGVTYGSLRRTSSQRLHDALVLMAQRSATLGNVSLARPLLSVLVGYETFAGRICQLANGAVVTPGQVAAMLTDADIERVVFDGPSRVIDLGRRSRVFVGGARHVIEVRDQECTDALCDVTAAECDVDHIIRWEHDGETNEDNGRLRCPHHNPGRRKRPPQPPP